jgi:hypothetical protein
VTAATAHNIVHAVHATPRPRFISTVLSGV